MIGFPRSSSRKSRLDGVFLGAVLSLLIVGSLAVFSATRPLPYYHQALERHFSAMLFGLFIFTVAANFAYEVYEDQFWAVYGFIISCLVAVLLVGTVHKGHRSWIQLGFFAFQPSEFARVGMILILAAIFDKRALKMEYLSTISMSLAAIAPIVLLIVKQPDFSMTLTLFPIFFAMLFCAGAGWEYLSGLSLFSVSAASMPFLYLFLGSYYAHPSSGSLLYFFMEVFQSKLSEFVFVLVLAAIFGAAYYANFLMRWRLRASLFLVFWLLLTSGVLVGIAVSHKLKGYQKSRFTAYINPHSDIHGAAYHVHQSQIAIGSGGFIGKGLFSGTQSQLGFLPERHTDFIYSVIGEEMGFVGAVIVILLYLGMIWRITEIGSNARDRYGYLVCCGIASMFAFDFILNVGMCLGLFPVAGIPLPLISYGGSSLMASLWSLGIVANVGRRKYALL